MKYRYSNLFLMQMLYGTIVFFAMAGYFYYNDYENSLLIISIATAAGFFFLLQLINGFMNGSVQVGNSDITLFRIPKQTIRIQDIRKIEFSKNEIEISTRMKDHKIVKKLMNKEDLKKLENYLENLQTQIQN